MRLLGSGAERRSLSDSMLVRSVLETSTDAFVGVGTDGSIEDWNSAAERLFGVPSGQVVGRPIERLVRRGLLSPPGPDGLGEVLLHASGDVRTSVRARAKHACGREFPVEVSVLRGAGPTGWEARAFVRDLTRWQPVRPATGDRDADARAEQPATPSLEETIALLSSLRPLADLLVLADRDGAVQQACGPALSTIGLDGAKLAGWGWLAALHPDDAPAFESGWREALGAARPVRGTARLGPAGGPYRRYELSAAPVRSLSCELTCWVIAGRDIEESVALKQQLYRFERAIARARGVLDGATAGACSNSASMLGNRSVGSAELPDVPADAAAEPVAEEIVAAALEVPPAGAAAPADL